MKEAVKNKSESLRIASLARRYGSFRMNLAMVTPGVMPATDYQYGSMANGVLFDLTKFSKGSLVLIVYLLMVSAKEF